MAQTQVAKDLLQDSNWINKTQNIMQENVMSLFEKFYKGAQDLVYSSATTTIVIVIVCIWLLDKVKNGYPSQQELFQGLKYIIILSLIFATLSSFIAYQGVLYILTIPENVITAVVSSIWENHDFAQIVTESGNRVDNIRELMWKYGNTEYIKSTAVNVFGFTFNNPMDHIMARLITAVTMIPFWIFYIVFFLLLIGITIVIFFSKFMAFLILATLPLVIPFLITPRFLPYLWSWYKLYLSYAIIAPLAFIALNLAMNPIQELEKWANAGNIGDLFIKQFEYLITGTITCITAMILLKRIPSWINAVLGTQMESGSGGVAGGVVAGAIAGKTMMGGIVNKAMGNSFVGGALSALGRASGGRAGGQIVSATTKAIGNTAKDFIKFRGGHAVP